jgi:hypothetical protein
MHLKGDVGEETKPIKQPSPKTAGMKKNKKTDGEDCEVVLTVLA